MVSKLIILLIIRIKCYNVTHPNAGAHMNIFKYLKCGNRVVTPNTFLNKGIFRICFVIHLGYNTGYSFGQISCGCRSEISSKKTPTTISHHFHTHLYLETNCKWKSFVR